MDLETQNANSHYQQGKEAVETEGNMKRNNKTIVLKSLESLL